MGKTQPSKKELNEQKKKEEEHAAAQVINLFYDNILILEFSVIKINGSNTI